MFGIQNMACDQEPDDKLLDDTSGMSDGRATFNMAEVQSWRIEQLLKDSYDFAFVFASCEQACANAGRAVAGAYSRCMMMTKPVPATDVTDAKAVRAPLGKIQEVDV